MKTPIVTVIVFMVSTLLHAQSPGGQVKTAESPTPGCLGPACITPKSSTRNLFAEVGAPPTEGVPYCYRTEDGRASLAIGVLRGELIDLDLNSSGRCDPRFPSGSTSADLRGWKTLEGIHLGSSVEDVFRAYGKPYRAMPHGAPAKTVEEPPSQIREGEFGYQGSLRVSATSVIPFYWDGMFTFRAGRVSRIELRADVYSGPLRLGPFAIDRAVTLQSLFKVLGPSPRSQCYCYRAQVGSPFLAIVPLVLEPPNTAGEVVLSDFPVCMHMSVKVTGADLGEWRTPEGIGLGSLEEEVVRAYGRPTFPDSGPGRSPDYLGCYRQGEQTPYIDGELDYNGPEVSFARFGMRKGKVSYIVLSNNE